MVGKRAPLSERFWSKVDKRGPDECWPWTAHHNGVGYGMIWSPEHGRKITASRCSYEINVGPIPDGMLIMHACDNPPCVNPAHLRVGTDKDNFDDSAQKGRRYVQPKKWVAKTVQPHGTKALNGSKNGFAKLTEADVRVIYAKRLSGQKCEHIAKAFGLDPSTVGDIINGVHWRHMLGTQGCPTLEQLQAVKTSTTFSKLSTEQAREIKQRIKAGEPIKPLAREFGIAFQTVSDIKRGKSWTFL